MVYYRNTADQGIYGYDPATQQHLIDQAISAGWTLLPQWPLPPSDSELMEQCRRSAISLLYNTDWTAMPEVANSQNSPYLTNQSEFISYRNEIRKLVVNPVPNPVWPTKPNAQWSSN